MKEPDLRIFTTPEGGDYAVGMARGLVAGGLPEDATEIYRARNVVVITSDGKLCIKAYKVPGAFKGFMYGLLRKSKARRAFENAQRLLELGIDTPAPLLAVESRHLGRLGASYFVSEAVHGLTNLRGIEKRADFPALAKAVAAFMLSLHKKGIWMKDFSQGNVLFKQKGEDYLFTLVDINRMEFDVYDRKRLLTNFGAVTDTASGAALIAREYSRMCESSPDAADTLAATCMEIYERRHRFLERKRALKTLFK